ncbi:MAG: arginase [Nitrososphaerota archaeon]|nr:arginase [Nitrososphaerota archaeon]
MNGKMNIGIVGVPMDLGQRRRGVDMGPTAIRIAGLYEKLCELNHTVHDYGNIPGPDRSILKVGDEKLRYLDEVLRICEHLSEQVSQIVGKGDFPLILGGDQSISMGVHAGLAHKDTRRGIIWIDAHGDFNTPETTPSGSIHGMALAAILGYGDQRLTQLGRISPKAMEENSVLIAGRSFDREEAERLRKSKVTVFTMKEVDELGMRSVMQQAIHIASKGVKEVHLSFDIDALDPREAPGTGTPVVGGLTYREAQLAMEMLFESGILTSAEFVEVNTILDERNRTAELAVQLILSIFGKQILGLQKK